jgi:hypothetical protein
MSDQLLDESEAVTTRLFKEVDRLLRDNCCLTESQLSLTDIRPAEANSEGQSEDRAYLQRSAIRILSSLCTYAEVEKHHGSVVFEKAFLRIVRTWGSTQVPRNIHAPFSDTSSTSSGRAIAFAELSSVTIRRSVDLQAQQRDSTRLAAGFFGDLLITSSNNNREREFRLLDALIRLFVTPSHPGSKFNWHLALRKAWKYVEDQLPALVAKCVAEKDYLLLCLTTGFRGYLLEKKASLEKAKSTPEHVVGVSNSEAHRQCGQMILSSKQDLEKKTADLCLEPKLIERILPLIFMNSDRSGLIFFTRDVLKGMTLHKMITHREQLILKGFVWELGRDPRRIGQAMRAIRAAAIARTQEPHNSLPDKSSHRALLEEAVGAKESSTASHWVTSHFMYLLVNVIQHKWNSRSSDDRVHALRCLNGLLDFLLPSESSQFFPQIMGKKRLRVRPSVPPFSSHRFVTVAAV